MKSGLKNLLWYGMKKAIESLKEEDFGLELEVNKGQVIIQVADILFPDSPALVHKYDIPEGESEPEAIVNAIALFLESVICDAIDYEILQEDRN